MLEVRHTDTSPAFPGWSRYTAEVRRPGGREAMTWLIPQDTAPLSEDWLVPSSLLLAMARGMPLRIHGRVSRRLLASTDAIQRMLLADNPQLSLVPVDATGQAPGALPPGRGTLSCFSAGVDSYYTALDPDLRIDDLLFVSGFEAPHDDDLQHFRLLSGVVPAAQALGKPLRLVETTFLENVEKVVGRTGLVGLQMHIGAAMLMSSRFSRLVIPASNDMTCEDTDLTPFSAYLPHWSSDALDIVQHGLENRVAKIQRVVEHEPASRHLRVCWATGGRAYNCGRCSKCVRTILNQELAGCPGRILTLPRRVALRQVARTRITRHDHVDGMRECLEDAERRGRTQLAEALARCIENAGRAPSAWRRLAERPVKMQRRLLDSLAKRRTRRALAEHRSRHGDGHLFTSMHPSQSMADLAPESRD